MGEDWFISVELPGVLRDTVTDDGVSFVSFLFTTHRAARFSASKAVAATPVIGCVLRVAFEKREKRLSGGRRRAAFGYVRLIRVKACESV